MSQQNFLAVVRASKLLLIMATMAMMLWSVGTAGAKANRDLDNDGLTNSQERNVTHTSPYKADTDGDHIKDGNEDSDGDGVDNTNEGKVGTQMGDADTDNDGIEDGDEDADGDGAANEDDQDEDDCDGIEDEDDQGQDEQ